MKDLRSLVLCAAAISSLTVVGCKSDGDNDNSDGGATTDGGTIRTDGGRDGGGGRPDGSAPAQPVADALTAYYAGETAINAAICTCWESLEYASEAECLTWTATPTEVRACETGAIAGVDQVLSNYYSCRATAYQAYADCLTAAGCSNSTERTGCGSDFDADLEECPQLEAMTPEVTAINAYGEAIDTCAETSVVGDGADTCVSNPPTPTSLIGENAYEGTTIGAGNHHHGAPVGDGEDQDCSSNDSGAADVTIAWKAPYASTFLISTAGSTFDTTLYFLPADNCAGEPIACNDDIEYDAGNFRSTIVREFAAGEVVNIVIDGYSPSEAGRYTLHIIDENADGGVPTVDAGTTTDDASVSTPDAGTSTTADAGTDA